MKISDSTRTILVGEDEPDVMSYFELALKHFGYSVTAAQDGDEVLSHLKSARSEISAVLLDIIMPNRDGIETLREIRSFDPSVPVIVVSGAASPQNIISAMKNGATDFLCKPITHQELHGALSNALGAHLYSPPARNFDSAQVYAGGSPPMKEIQQIIKQIGWSEVPVLIQGETGTGKEVLARALHAQSPRSEMSFLKLNCAALPSELVESELFGYEKGAFTGAVQRKTGMFEQADGGTLLLDEIGDMELRLQAKLLQVLQDQEFRRIGGKETIRVDVRVIAATHRDLEMAMAAHTFREDLYYRLSVVNLHVPALRDRKEDIIPLTEFLVRKHSKEGVPTPNLTSRLKQALLDYHWPGNVRELENYVRKLAILRDSDAIARELQAKESIKLVNLHVALESSADPEAPDGSHILQQVSSAKRQVEAAAVLAALESNGWNRKRAAALLNIDYKALLYKMKKLGIDKEHRPNSGLPRKPTTSNAT